MAVQYVTVLGLVRGGGYHEITLENESNPQCSAMTTPTCTGLPQRDAAAIMVGHTRRTAVPSLRHLELVEGPTHPTIAHPCSPMDVFSHEKCTGKPGGTEAVKDMLANLPKGLRVVTNFGLVDICPDASGKHNAAAYLAAEHFEISLDRCASMGDDDNDIALVSGSRVP